MIKYLIMRALSSIPLGHMRQYKNRLNIYALKWLPVSFMDGGKSSGYFSKNMKPFFLMEGWKSCGIDIRQNSHLTPNFL